MAGRPPKNGVAKSVTSEVVMGRASQSINKAVVSLKEAFQHADSLEERFEDLSLKVANKEEELASIDLKIAEKERQSNVDLELKLRSNAERTVNDFLIQQGKIAVKQETYDELLDELTQLKSDMVTQIKAEVGKAEGIASSRYTNELKLKEAEFKAKEAGNAAEIESLKKEVIFLNAQLLKWEKALDEERKASVERSKASAIGNVTLGSDSTNGRR
jgi:hypothetical protein